MSEKFYAPSEYTSIDQDRTVPAAKKLEIIAGAQPTVSENVLGGFRIILPFVWGVSAESDAGHSNTLYLHAVDVGDEELYGHGIGTRLLHSAAKYGMSKNPSLESIRAIDADLGLVYAMVKSFGEENVRVSLSRSDHYGMGTERELEEIFNTQPPIEGEPYKVWEVSARIDRDQSVDWEIPVNQKQQLD